MAYPKDRPNPPSHVAHFLVHGLVSGISWANSFWVRNGNATAPSLGDFETWTQNFCQLYNARFTGHFPPGVDLAGCEGLYYGPTGADMGSSISLNVTGNSGDEAMPNNTSTVISWKLQQRYKGGHPRTYLPPTSHENLQDGRLYKTSYVGDVASKANAFIDDVNDLSHGEMNDCHLGVVSFVLRKDWRDPPVFRDYVPGGATVDARIDSMRRRLGRDV